MAVRVWLSAILLAFLLAASPFTQGNHARPSPLSISAAQIRSALSRIPPWTVVQR
jgi:hypothetical protein